MVCIGGGASLTAEDVALAVASDARIIAINDAYLIAPSADVNYFADARWWKWHTDGIAKRWIWASFTKEEQRERFASFAGIKVTIENTGAMVADPEVFMLHNAGNTGLSAEPNALCTGSNSGYQAINFAVLAGASRILLLGYDMHFAGTRSHSHNGHPLAVPEGIYVSFAPKYRSMLPHLEARGVSVVNCSPGSRIDAFPKASIESILSTS